MRLLLSISLRQFPTRPKNVAFTLPEVMIAMGVFSLVVMGVISSHIFGLKMATMTRTKLITTHEAREALNRVREDVRSGRIVYVGNGSSSSFTHIPANSPQQGNAVLIHQTVNTNRFVQYFMDSADDTLKRRTSGGQVDVIANYITNTIIFRAEDYLGNVLTNDQNNRVIRMNLEFYQWEFSDVYEYYRLQTKITCRAIE